MAGGRRKAREIVIQTLYEVDSAGHGGGAVIDRLLLETGLEEHNAAFARELLAGVTSNREEIDELVRKLAPAWPLEQIPAIDRNILRLAIFEILLDNKVPVKVAINEAVELAKTFGSESSPKFVNGVLGTVSSLAGRR